MVNNWKKTMTGLLVASMMTVMAPAGAVMPAVYASAVSPADGSGFTPLGSLHYSDGRNVEFGRVQMLPDGQRMLVLFTLRHNNREATTWSLYDYTVRLTTVHGSRYDMELLSDNKDVRSIPPGTTLTQSYYAYVSKDTKPEELRFDLIKWDLSAPSMELKLDTAGLPEGYSTVVPAGEAGRVELGSSVLSAETTRLHVSTNEEKRLATLFLKLRNVSPLSAVLPELQFMLRTPEGNMYPMKNEGFPKDLSLSPQAVRERALTAEIPISDSPDGWQLVIARKVTPPGSATAEPILMPLAFMEFPAAENEADAWDSAGTFTNKYGEYAAELMEAQRLPRGDVDLLALRLKLKNPGKTTLPIPELAGHLLLDDTIKVNVQYHRTDRIIGLTPGAEMIVYALASIPYGHSFDKVKLKLQEKTSEGLEADLLDFSHAGALKEPRIVAVGGSHPITHIGQKSEYRATALERFTSGAADLIVVLLELENKEPRPLKAHNLVANIMLKDGSVYPAALSELTTSIAPGGKGQQLAYINVRKEQSVEGSRILIGEAAGNDGSYINAAYLELPQEKATGGDNLKRMELTPYFFSMNSIGTYVDIINNKLSTRFEYELDRDPLLEADTKDHQVIVELTDGKFQTSRTFSLENKEGNASDSFWLGTHTVAYTVEEPELLSRISLSRYKLNIYHQYRNGKRLIATKDVSWFVNSDLK